MLCFGRAAETLARHRKGDLVSLAGRVSMNRWIGKDGGEREQLQVIADTAISARTVRPGVARKKKDVQQDDAPFDDPVSF